MVLFHIFYNNRTLIINKHYEIEFEDVDFKVKLQN